MTGHTVRPDVGSGSARVGGRALILGLAVFLGSWIWAWTVLPPDGVVHHLGTEGVGRVGSRGGLLWPLMVIVLAVVSMRWLIAWTARNHPSVISYPSACYWLAPQRREGSIRRMVDELDMILAGTVLLVAAALLEVLGTTLARGWPSVLWPALAAYLVFLAWWTWWMVRRSRPPGG